MDPLSCVPQFTPRMGLTSASANPEGCQKLAGGRSAAQTPVRVAQCVGTLEGCQKLADFLAPFQGAADDGALTGGIARCASLNLRLISGIPPGWGEFGAGVGRAPGAQPGSRQRLVSFRAWQFLRLFWTGRWPCARIL